MSSRKRRVPVPTTNMSDPPDDTKVLHGFDVVFAGLICIARTTPYMALFANGLIPKDPTVNPHHPYLIINPKTPPKKEVGWQNIDPLYKQLGVYQLPSNCRIEISGATDAGTLDPSQHDQNTPRLYDVDQSITIDPDKADAVVRVKLVNGTLQALRHPDSVPSDPDAAIISRLRIENYMNPITVDVWEGTAISRSLELQPMTDIALVNIGLPLVPGKLGNHFSIYGALTKNGTINGYPTSSNNVTIIHSDYQVFNINFPIVDGLAMCGTSGCCPPP